MANRTLMEVITNCVHHEIVSYHCPTTTTLSIPRPDPMVLNMHILKYAMHAGMKTEHVCLHRLLVLREQSSS